MPVLWSSGVKVQVVRTRWQLMFSNFLLKKFNLELFVFPITDEELDLFLEARDVVEKCCHIGLPCKDKRNPSEYVGEKM